MPRVIKLYEKSRKGLKHNMGGFFGKPKETKSKYSTIMTECKKYPLESQEHADCLKRARAALSKDILD